MSHDWVRSGRAWRFGDDVSIEEISPLRYMTAPEGRGRACLKRLDPEFAATDKDGDLLVAGRMFGHGPGHDHAILALREAGVAGVVASSFAPQFFRHAIGHGLLVAERPDVLELVARGDQLSMDFDVGHGRNLTTGVDFAAQVPQGAPREILAAGGLVAFLRQQLADERAATPG